MTASLLLRIVIYGIGLFSTYSGLTNLVYYLHVGSSDGIDVSTGFALVSPIVAFVVTPLVLALACFGFANTIAGFLLGSAASLKLEGADWNGDAALTILLKTIGAYVFATHIGPATATVFELLALRNGSTHFNSAQVTTDALANGIALFVSFVLALRTRKVIAWLAAHP